MSDGESTGLNGTLNLIERYVQEYRSLEDQHQRRQEIWSWVDSLPDDGASWRSFREAVRMAREAFPDLDLGVPPSSAPAISALSKAWAEVKKAETAAIGSIQVDTSAGASASEWWSDNLEKLRSLVEGADMWGYVIDAGRKGSDSAYAAWVVRAEFVRSCLANESLDLASIAKALRHLVDITDGADPMPQEARPEDKSLTLDLPDTEMSIADFLARFWASPEARQSLQTALRTAGKNIDDLRVRLR